MYFRRLRTVVNQVLPPGRLEAVFDAKVGPAAPEFALDFARWPRGFNTSYAAQRTASGRGRHRNQPVPVATARRRRPIASVHPAARQLSVRRRGHESGRHGRVRQPVEHRRAAIRRLEAARTGGH
jgi:hypothetical protein